MKLIAFVLSAVLLLPLPSFLVLAETNGAKLASAPSVLNFSGQSQEMVPVTAERDQTRAQDPELTRHFRKYDLMQINPEAAARQVKNRGKMILKTSHGNFELQFSPYDIRSSDYRAQEIGADGLAHKLASIDVMTFRGSVKDNPRAQARMSLGMDGLQGAIITGTDRYFIQPARALSKNAQADDFVFYSADDLAATDASCGVTLADEVAAQQQVAAATSGTDVTAELNNPITPISPMKVARIATDADAEYVNGVGGSTVANQQILNIMNMVDGIYQVEIGVTFQVVFQNAWTDQASDPYTTTVPSSLLTEFRNYWNANFTTAPASTRNLAHLWTGKDLDSSTIGIASLAVVCRTPSSAYGLSQRFPLFGAPDARSVILTAHEIGHNFSAAHTNQPGKDVPPEFTISCSNSIMEAALGSRTGSSFCAFSRSQIVGHATAYGSCLGDSASAPPVITCTETPITPGVTVNGSLANTDCGSPSRGETHFADRYTFDGTTGQQVTISMDQTSGNVDPYLYLIAPDGFIIDQAEFGSGINARIPETSNTGVFTLPQTGRYIIEATSSVAGQTGGYQLTLSPNGCTLSASATVQNFSAAGGGASLNLSVSGTCGNYNVVPDPATTGSNWITLASGGGSGAQTINFTVAANGSSVGRRSFILIGPSGNNSDTGGIRIPITQSGTGPDCSVTPISVGQTLNGDLSAGDCESPIRGTVGLRADRYTFVGSPGQQVAIALNAGQTSPLSDPFLNLIGPNGNVILNDDDGGGGTNSRIPGGTGTLTLGLPGTYTIEVSSFSAGQFGSYVLSLTGTADWQPTILSAGQVFLNSWKIDGHTFVYAKLTFPDAGYRVANWGTPVQAGNAFTDDATIEKFNGVSIQAIASTAQIWDLGVLNAGDYTFAFRNSGTTVTTLPFTVSSTAPPPNPIDDARTFVLWQYRDFLRREPDLPGWDHWTGEITMCSDAANRRPGETEAQCVDRKRENTSAAFFVSPEFQNTGYFVLRVYRGSLGRMPFFGGTGGPTDEFTRDAATVGQGIVVNDALAPDVMNANKQTFVNQFVTRADFKAIYDGLNNTQYVDKLFQTTGVTPSGTDRQALIDGLTNGTETRPSVLFKVVDGTQTGAGGLLTFNTTYGKAFYDNLFNAAFVQMEYFGYLRRDPDPGGYDFWFAKLNFFGDWVNAEMVKSFIKSPEYRARFGAP